jgi:hypothetical protein
MKSSITPLEYKQGKESFPTTRGLAIISAPHRRSLLALPLHQDGVEMTLFQKN